jgi:DnaJ homolog subfamily A member 2
VSEKKTFEVAIEPGARHGQKIVLRGEAGVSEPGLEPGDVVLVVAQKEHSVFQRMRHNSQDLVIQREVSLRDALCGVSFTVKHLDGRLLHITSPTGEVVKPGSFQCVPEEGMPFPGRPYVKGHLYINFQVGRGERGGPRTRACVRVPTCACLRCCVCTRACVKAPLDVSRSHVVSLAGSCSHQPRLRSLPDAPAAPAP